MPHHGRLPGRLPAAARVAGACAAACAAAACATGGDAYRAAFEARQTLDTFLSSAGARDLQRMDELLTDDVFVFDQGEGGKPVRLQGKAEVGQYLARVVSGAQGYSSTLSDVHTVFTQNAAWVTATWRHSVTSGGATTSWRQVGSFFLLRDPSGAWKIAGWHASHAEEQEPPPAPAMPGGGPGPTR